MATSSELDDKVSCEDFQAFQVVLRQMRTLDDRLIHALNTSLPTDSFRQKGIDPGSQCKEVYEQMLTAHTQREQLIKRCVSKKSANVARMREDRVQDRDNMVLLSAMRKEQTQLRLMQNELSIEEVVQDTANKANSFHYDDQVRAKSRVFHERCRLFFTPPQDQ